MHSYRRAEDRLHCLAGWFLLARFLGDGNELDESRLEYVANGKPRLRNGPEFNLAHCGNFVLLALSDMPVGADIEQWRDEDHMRLARAAFHAGELAALGTADMPRQFYELWVLKESFLKMRGLGLGVNPASIRLYRRGGAVLVAGEENIFFKLYHDIPGYSIAVCSTQSDWPDEVTFVDL